VREEGLVEKEKEHGMCCILNRSGLQGCDQSRWGEAVGVTERLGPFRTETEWGGGVEVKLNGGCCRF